MRLICPAILLLVAEFARIQTGNHATIPLDLNAPDAAARWEFVGGEWEVQAGRLLQNRPAGSAFAFLKEPVLGDVTFSLQLLAYPEGDGVKAPGVLLRSADSESFYGLHLDTKNDQAVLYVSPWKGLSDWIVLARKHPIELNPYVWYAVRVEAHGSHLRVYLDGQLLLEATDERYRAGLVGVYTSQGRAAFADLHLEGETETMEKTWRVVPLEYQVLPKDLEAGGYAAFPDVCRLKNGDLLCVFYAGYGHVSVPTEALPYGGRVSATRSTDGGQTWSPAFVLADTPYDDRDPSIAQLSDGTLICNFFSVWPAEKRPPGKTQEYAVYLTTSTDNGLTWDEPRPIDLPSPLAYACSAPIRELPDGSLLLGLYHEVGGRAWGATAKSYDRGQTWTDLATIGEDSGLYLDAETDVVRLADGTLFAALRSSQTDLYYATSTDNGRSWSAVQSFGFKGRCPYLLRTRDGVLLVAHRLPGTSLHYSLDEGQTWSENVLIDGVDGAYPSLVELDDGTILVVYYEEGEGSNIRAKRFRATRAGIEFVGIGAMESGDHGVVGN